MIKVVVGMVVDFVAIVLVVVGLVPGLVVVVDIIDGMFVVLEVVICVVVIGVVVGISETERSKYYCICVLWVIVQFLNDIFS